MRINFLLVESKLLYQTKSKRPVQKANILFSEHFQNKQTKMADTPRDKKDVRDEEIKTF